MNDYSKYLIASIKIFSQQYYNINELTNFIQNILLNDQSTQPTFRFSQYE